MGKVTTRSKPWPQLCWLTLVSAGSDRCQNSAVDTSNLRIIIVDHSNVVMEGGLG